MRKLALLLTVCLSAAGCTVINNIIHPLPARPALAQRPQGDPAALSEADLVASLNAANSNFFQLQEFFLRNTRYHTKVSGGDFETKFTGAKAGREAAWATETLKAESDAMAAMIPLVEKLTQGAVQHNKPAAPPPYAVSFAIFDMGPQGIDAAVWETARLRANLSTYLLSLYSALASGDASPERIAELNKSILDAKALLAPKPAEPLIP